MEKEKKLNALNVAFFESRHSKTLGDLIALQGGIPIAAPALKEVPLEKNTEVLDFAGELFAGKIDVLVLLTGVGTKAMVEILESRYSRAEIFDALKKIKIVPRGPKPIRVLREWGIPFSLTVPEPNTWKELLKSIDENADALRAHSGAPVLRDMNIAVQEYGVSNPELIQGLEERGAKVMRVPVYRWTLPDDIRPLTETILKMVSGQVQVAVFTTAVQIEHVIQVAAKLQLETQLKKAFERIVVASVGPDCTEALKRCGVPVDIQPASPKMGPLIAETALKAWESLRAKRSNDEGGKEVDVRSRVLELTQEKDLLHESLFLKACRCEPTPVTPVWLMRQAGRYMKDYRDIRERVSFLDLCKNPDLACEVTVTAQEKLKADAAIIFSDILVILEPMGLSVNYLKGGGPSIVPTLTMPGAVDALREVHPKESLGYVFDAIRLTRRQLKGDVPLLGFAGAPFTLASYMIEGGASKTFVSTRKFMNADHARWKALMDKLVRATTAYLNGQIEAGASAVQLFDSWAGTLEASEYEQFVLPYTKQLIQGITPGVPVINFSTRTGAYIDKVAQAGGDVIGVDHRVPLDEAWMKIGPAKAVQGNLDPLVLCSDLAEIKRHTQRVLAEAAGRPGHIFNLGHGVLPETPVENAVALVDMVHQLSRR